MVFDFYDILLYLMQNLSEINEMNLSLTCCFLEKKYIYKCNGFLSSFYKYRYKSGLIFNVL